MSERYDKSARLNAETLGILYAVAGIALPHTEHEVFGYDFSSGIRVSTSAVPKAYGMDDAECWGKRNGERAYVCQPEPSCECSTSIEFKDDGKVTASVECHESRYSMSNANAIGPQPDNPKIFECCNRSSGNSIWWQCRRFEKIALLRENSCEFTGANKSEATNPAYIIETSRVAVPKCQKVKSATTSATIDPEKAKLIIAVLGGYVEDGFIEEHLEQIKALKKLLTTKPNQIE